MIDVNALMSTSHQTNGRDAPYPLICVCAVPVPEWVYVANQCVTCKRLIRETTP